MLPSIYGELKSHLLNEKPVWKSLACAQEAPQTAIGGLDQLKKSKFEDEDSDEEEHFVDADKQETKETRNKTVSETEKSKGWHHREKVSRSDFDAWARNPSYSNVDGEKAWELVSMANHFHPSVSMFAKNVISGGDEKYPGDPLNDFTIMRFLDRFVYKNPKAERKSPRSINQRRVNKYLDTHQLPVTSLEFLQAKEHELGPHDRFMQKFFQMRASGVTSKAKEDQDIDDVDDDEFDRILDGDLRGWENRVGKIDSTLATPKQRKAMKKRGDLEELEDLDDDDIDFGDLYSDDENEEEEEISPELIEDYDGILSDEDEEESPTKRVKLAKLEQDAEQVGDLLDDAGILSKQEKWEQGRNKKRGVKNNIKSKGPRKRTGKMKSTKKR
ncbi:Oidioi.mRNA.OKI2018_I69.XSR.g15808.t1.cds [Oikopleura dioica]|uniref:Oidioi.mRNA.OKI2018_I69.XSR.g15808.t1.cds n=1 Tax=Oikopleura dioica TaxID=34765 RepID=A0ABN7SEJ4_OIKDI|nr:Oidioi.mRNA.OKI2018_I69.XSR.g15808.t1.cds [Oikopleura dioica]